MPKKPIKIRIFDKRYIPLTTLVAVIAIILIFLVVGFPLISSVAEFSYKQFLGIRPISKLIQPLKILPQMCAGTNTNCGVYPNCINCNNYDSWYNVGSSYSCCDGNYSCSCQNKEYRDYYCSGTSCIYSAINTTTVKSSCTDCNSYDSYTTCSWSCADSTTRRCTRSYNDYSCSAGACAYTSSDASYNEACASGYVCSGGSCVSAQLPDLSVASADISFSPSSPTEGQTVNISAVIYNDGNASAGSFVVAFTDVTKNYLIGTQTQSSLAAKSGNIKKVSYYNVSSGNHTIRVNVDYYNNITEWSEANNQADKILGVSLL